MPAADRPAPIELRLLRVTPWVATVSALVAVVGLVGLLRPVSTPVQDCGVAAAFLLDGRTNQFADPGDPPAGVTAAEVTANNERPCRERVADIARPAAIALLIGTAIGLIAAIVEVASRITLRHHRRVAATAGADGDGGAEEPEAGTEPEDHPEPDAPSRQGER